MGLLRGGASYSGTETHRYIDELIARSGRLDIVTPYISLGYAKVLAGHARRHRVRLITSGSGSNFAAMEYLSKFDRPYRPWLKAGLFVAALGAIAWALGFMQILPILAGTAAGMLAISALMAGRRRSRLRVKVSSKVFVHEKLYISDRTAIVGSANLTHGGTRRNLEHVDIVDDRKAVEGLHGHFDSLWGSL